MKIFQRMSKGWSLGLTSLNIIKENPALLIFPVVSGAALIVLIASFFGGGYFLYGEQVLGFFDETADPNQVSALAYVYAFVAYLIINFVIVFFNVGLVYCAKKVMEGEETTFAEGFQFATTRIVTIMSWAALAATVGLVLKALQDRLGSIGDIIVGLVGIVWGVATFFVVPVLAYEDVSPIEAVKRSAKVMKEKWGESLGANFSFGLFTLIGLFLVAIPLGLLIGFTISPFMGVAVGILLLILIQAVTSAANTVFLAAAYQSVHDQPTGSFNSTVLDDLFIHKPKKTLF